jgi:hypothetical protein
MIRQNLHHRVCVMIRQNLHHHVYVMIRQNLHHCMQIMNRQNLHHCVHVSFTHCLKLDEICADMWIFVLPVVHRRRMARNTIWHYIKITRVFVLSYVA